MFAKWKSIGVCTTSLDIPKRCLVEWTTRTIWSNNASRREKKTFRRLRNRSDPGSFFDTIEIERWATKYTYGEKVDEDTAEYFLRSLVT